MYCVASGEHALNWQSHTVVLHNYGQNTIAVLGPVSE